MQQQNAEVQVRDMDRYVEAARRTEPDYGPVVERLANPEMARLLHVAMGLVTEAAEFVDQLKRHLFYGARLDATNLLEELGDVTWYQRIGVDELRSSLLDILDRNVAKLRARFPEKFTEDKAVNRDLDAERAVLEAAPVQQYYVLTRNRDERVGYENKCVLWWRPEGKGYTTNLDEAGLFTDADKAAMYPHAERCHYVPKEVVDACSRRLRLAWWNDIKVSL